MEYKVLKAICIKNYDQVNSRRTTIGKVYEIYQEKNDDAYFVGDNGDELWYEPNYFKKVEKHRENQINKILE